MDKKLHILIAHHQKKVRSALTFLLSQELSIDVVGEASNLDELVIALRSTQPDVVLLEHNLSGETLTEQIAELQGQAGDLKIVVLCSGTETMQTGLSPSDYTIVDITGRPKQLVTALRVLQLESENE